MAIEYNDVMKYNGRECEPLVGKIVKVVVPEGDDVLVRKGHALVYIHFPAQQDRVGYEVPTNTLYELRKEDVKEMVSQEIEPWKEDLRKAIANIRSIKLKSSVLIGSKEERNKKGLAMMKEALRGE